MLPLDPTPEQLDLLIEACARLVRDHHATLQAQPSADLDGAEGLAASFREPLPEQGRPLDPVLARLEPAFAKSFNTAGPGYLAFIPGGGLPVAALAEWLSHSFNRYVGVNRAAPALAQIEATAVRWLCDLMGYPAGARGLLTTGGSLANFAAVVAARSAKLHEDELLQGVIYASDEAHQSVLRAARLAGFPARAVRTLPSDAAFRLRPDDVARAVAEDRARGRKPFLIAANAGSTNTGAIDPLPALADLAQREGLWLHADGAYGGFFRLAPDGASLLQGLERADSITLDPHKGLFLPYGTGALVVRDGEALLRAHQDTAAYLHDVRAEGEPNFADLGPELSRDFRGLRLWLPLMLHGAAAFRGALGEKLRLAQLAHALLAEDPRFEILAPVQTSVLAFRLRASDEANLSLLRRVNERGRVFLSSTTLRGRAALRICVLSFRTHEDRVRDAVQALRDEAGR